MALDRSDSLERDHHDDNPQGTGDGEAPAEPSQPQQAPPVADPESRRIAQLSPEGIPGDPHTDRHAVGRFIQIIVVIALVVALALAVFVNRWVGVAVGVLALGLMLFNPVLWAAILRAKEREH